MHPNRMESSVDGDLTHVEFDIEKHWTGPYDYVRISIIDKIKAFFMDFNLNLAPKFVPTDFIIISLQTL